MYNEIIKLAHAERLNNYGDIVEIVKWDTAREVFCEVSSITQQEFYLAAQSGFKPSLKIKLADYYDYNDEDRLLYDGHEYRIIRTYRNGTSIELTAERYGNEKQ